MKTRSLIWLLSPMLCAIAGAEEPAPKPQKAEPVVVQLRFGWQPGFRSAISSKVTKVVRQNATSAGQARSVSGTYTLTAERDGEHLRIRYADFVFAGGSGQFEGADAVTAQALEQLSRVVPDFHVSTAGEIVGIPNLSEYQARQREMLRAVLPKNESVRIDKVIEFATSEQAIGQAVSEQWDACVGAWAGREFELGATYEFETEDVVPMLANQTVRSAGTASVNREIPCQRSGTARRCVQLEMLSSPNSADLLAGLKRMGEQIGAPPPPENFSTAELEIESRIELITEPDGLIPHRCTYSKRLKSQPNSGAEAVPLQETELTFSYPSNP